MILDFGHGFRHPGRKVNGELEKWLLTLGRDRVGETVGPVITDVVFDRSPRGIINEPFPDQDRLSSSHVEFLGNGGTSKSG